MGLRIEGVNIASNLLFKLDKADKIIAKNLYQLGINTANDVKARIESGKGTNGESMETKSDQRKGRYSKDYAVRTREPRGKTIERVTLNLTGGLIESYGAIERSDTRVVVGFADEEHSTLAGYHETYYNQPIFDASEREIKTNIAKFFDSVNKEIEI